ncbi:alpha/beta fold hydrolase [Roseibium sp. M-1]
MTTAPQEALKDTTAVTAGSSSDFTWQGPDGLLLSGRQWWPVPSPDGGRNTTPIPVLCLPGLSRNIRDFNDIAAFLQSRGHRVIALDYRGRGKSAWDPDWRNYALTVEEKDIDAAIEALGLDRFALLGTSRGGLHALAMGLRYPATRMAAVIFNDIGPHIEMRAIHRIAATLGRNMKHSSFDALASGLEHVLGQQFPGFASKDWLKLAGQLASEQDGGVVLDYDPALAHQFASLDDAAPAPDLWPLYEKLKDRPVLVLRGAHSDLLSAQTSQCMIESHPSASLRTIAGQGHAPVLWDRDTHEAVAGFLKGV